MATPASRTSEAKRQVGSMLFWDSVYTVLILAPIIYVIVLYCIDYGTFQFNSRLLAKNVFWILATIPALAAVVHFLVAELPRYRRRLRAYEQIISAESLAKTGYRTKDLGQLLSRYAADAEDVRPYFSGVLFGSACFVLVFGTAASLSSGHAGIGILEKSADRTSGREVVSQRVRPTPPPGEGGATTATDDSKGAASKNATPTPAISKKSPTGKTGRVLTASTAAATPIQDGNATKSEESVRADEKKKAKTEADGHDRADAGDLKAQPRKTSAERDEEGNRGLVFAAYGSYIYVLRLFIGRLNSSGLSGKFLLRLALRGAIALVLGYSAGALGIFTAVAEGGPSLFAYFCVGLFPSWAMSALQQRGRKLFTPDEPGCDVMPLCLVDGLDDDISDRMAEMGISDVEHLAYSSPFELMLRTEFPQTRVLDWTDQAILINYVREKIVHFRKLGIRGAIEMAVLYGDYVSLLPGSDEEPAKREERAKNLLQTLAQKSEIPEAALLTIGRSLFEDQHVTLIWDLWQQAPTEGDGASSRGEDKPAAASTERSEPPAIEPHAGQPSDIEGGRS